MTEKFVDWDVKNQTKQANIYNMEEAYIANNMDPDQTAVLGLI